MTHGRASLHWRMLWEQWGLGWLGSLAAAELGACWRPVPMLGWRVGRSAGGAVPPKSSACPQRRERLLLQLPPPHCARAPCAGDLGEKGGERREKGVKGWPSLRPILPVMLLHRGEPSAGLCTNSALASARPWRIRLPLFNKVRKERGSSRRMGGNVRQCGRCLGYFLPGSRRCPKLPRRGCVPLCSAAWPE